MISIKEKIKKLIPDKIFLKILYRKIFNEKLNLKNPQTFNEKLQWLKLYNRNPEYTKMVDKYEAKNYVASVIGKEYIIPTIGLYDKFDDIDFDKLPNQFVIKCTHDCASTIIVKDKNNFDINEVRKKINTNLKKNFFYNGREWVYKNVKPRIIIEKYMEDKQNKSMRDYKFFCFNGMVELLYISDDSHTNYQKIAFFDKNFNKLDCKRKDYNDFKQLPNKPKNFEKMKTFSSILSRNIPHVRVDWYEINGKLYFGELTFYTCSGFIPFEDKEWDKKLGDLISLDKVDMHEK